MTTAFAQAQQTSSARDRQEQPNGTSTQIPVLIRLPDLATSTITVQAGSQLESDRQELPLSPHVARTAKNAAQEQPATQVEEEAATPELPKPTQRHERGGSWRSDFRLPSSVVHAAVALALVAVFVVAYMAIVGGGDNVQELAADKPAAGQEARPTDVSGQQVSAHGDSALVFNSFVPDAPKKPAAGGPSPANQAVAKSQGGAAKQPAKAPGAAAKQPAAKPNQTPANNPPAAAAAEQLAAKPDQPTAKTPPASTVAMTEPASSIQQAEFESPAVSNAKQPVGQVSPNQVQTDRPQGFRNETTLPQNLTSNNPSVDGSAEQPLVPGEAGPAANRSATSQPDYPATNPAFYQYPADYHERLLSPPGTYGSPQNSPWSGGAGDSQRPSTARLQPRIEPPPIR